MQEEKIDVAPLRLGSAIKGWVIIYGLTIVTNFILNAWMKAAPIGPWTGASAFHAAGLTYIQASIML